MKSLLVVESPSKAKTINKYLGRDYKVLASFGHIRDLPSKDGSVVPENDFEMKYKISSGATKAVKQLVDAMKECDKLILAPDPDREGEAIAWHVAEVLKDKKVLKGKEVERVVFNAVTKNAILEAMKEPRGMDMDLVNAQQARRALDYLVGFTLSPVLWKKVPGSRSAGRVQSVALRLICEREEEIEKFKAQEYWDIIVDLTKKEGTKKKIEARVTHINGKKLDKFDIADQKAAGDIVKQLETKGYKVVNVEKKQTKRKPYAPFTTSTLQQEASRKLGFSAKKTMTVAQKLYEGMDVGSGTHGLITYMRTDGVFTAPEAVAATRKLIEQRFGSDYLPKKAIVYQNKVKNAQEAHEAIRPTDPMLTPDKINQYLTEDQFKLYDLIWKRLIASQMENVVMDQVAIVIETDDKYGSLRATGSVINFDGFYILYREKDEDVAEEDEKVLPAVEVGEELNLKSVNPNQHFTMPPPRYSEASLVKNMEELGIGRPSTYASIISVLQARNYVKIEKRRFIPEERGRIVVAFLKEFFSKYVEYDYTANMEEKLDTISTGKLDWKKFLHEFWDAFHTTTEAVTEIDLSTVIDKLNKQLAPHIFGLDEKGEIKNDCPECKDGKLTLKFGKFGAFIACSNYPECKYTERLDEAIEQGQEGDGKSDAKEKSKKSEADSMFPKVLGTDKESGLEVLLKKGPYGIYVQLGPDSTKPKPKRTGLPKKADPNLVDLHYAMQLLALPRTVGKHPEDQGIIKAAIGPYGPYLMYNKKFYSLTDEDNVLDIGLNRAIVLIHDIDEKKKNAPAKKGGFKKKATTKKKAAKK